MRSRNQAEVLIEKIRELPAEKVAEVENFIDFIRERSNDRGISNAMSRGSQKAFAHVWDNDADADYDSL